MKAEDWIRAYAQALAKRGFAEWLVNHNPLAPLASLPPSPPTNRRDRIPEWARGPGYKP